MKICLELGSNINGEYFEYDHDNNCLRHCDSSETLVFDEALDIDELVPFFLKEALEFDDYLCTEITHKQMMNFYRYMVSQLEIINVAEILYHAVMRMYSDGRVRESVLIYNALNTTSRYQVDHDKRIEVIGLTGVAGSGKDTLAQKIKSIYNSNGLQQCKIVHFSDMLKLFLTRIGIDDVWTQEGKAAYNDKWGCSNRKLLQKFGTEIFRRSFGSDFWIRLLHHKYIQTAASGTTIIVADVRFEEEANFIKEIGGTLIGVSRVDNDTTPINLDEKEKKHPSETQVSILMNQADFIFYNHVKDGVNVQESLDFHNSVMDMLKTKPGFLFIKEKF